MVSGSEGLHKLYISMERAQVSRAGNIPNMIMYLPYLISDLSNPWLCK